MHARNSRKKKEQQQRPVESIWFIPHTEGGALRARINQMETEAAFSTRFKYVESTGQSLIHTLGVMDP